MVFSLEQRGLRRSKKTRHGRGARAAAIGLLLFFYFVPPGDGGAGCAVWAVPSHVTLFRLVFQYLSPHHSSGWLVTAVFVAALFPAIASRASAPWCAESSQFSVPLRPAGSL